MPFYTAFDGRDSFGTGPTLDFADSLEIALPTPDGLADWRYLAREYSILSAPAVVFHRVRRLTQSEAIELWALLASDRQFRRRAGRTLPRCPPQLLSIEYYLYYINDVGLSGGHPYDREIVFVFVPDPGSGAGDSPEPFRVVVGAGHGPSVPNNVLVETRRADVVRRPRIIVEYLDHSNAPDLPPFGEFRLGYDVNWYPEAAWGVRDVQASHGAGFSGRYASDQTFTRDSAAIVRLIPPEPGPERTVRAVDELGYGFAGTHTYRLVAAETMAELYAELALPEPSTTRIQELVDAIQESLGMEARFSHMDAIRKDAAIRRMKLWLAPVETGSGRYDAKLHQVWRHWHFERSPLEILKPYLYPNRQQGLDGAAVRLGLQIVRDRPDRGEVLFEFPYELVPPLVSFLNVPGYMTVGVGLAWPWAGQSTVSPVYTVMWERSFHAPATWYIRYRFSHDARDVGQLERHPASSFSVGVSFLRILSARDLLKPHALRIRAGVRMWLRGAFLSLEDSGFEIQVSGFP